MKNLSELTALVLFFLIGCFQLAAGVAGVQAWLGLPASLAFLLSMFIAWVPLAGTALGYFGAISAWGWPWWKSAMFFVGVLVTIVLLAGVSALQQRRAARRSSAPATQES